MRFTKQQSNLQAAQVKVVGKVSIIAQLEEQIKQLKFDPKTTAKDRIEFKSANGVDYTKLRDLLAVGEWKKADQETANAMLLAVNRESEGCLSRWDIDKFPCKDLHTINQLWLHYSGGKFGFSVQKKIYESLGGTKEYNDKVWESFGDRVGWKKGGNWLDSEKLTYSQSAPAAHLPAIFWQRETIVKSYLSKLIFWLVGSSVWFGVHPHNYGRLLLQLKDL